MRKILSGFLATAMVASVCATASFAASKSAYVTYDLNAPAAATNVYVGAQLIYNDGNEDVTLAQINFKDGIGDGTAVTEADIAKVLNGKTFTNVELGKKIYQVSLRANSAADKITATFSPAAQISGITAATDTFEIALITDQDTLDRGVLAATTLDYSGEGGNTADIELDGDELDVEEVIVCDGQGNPIPLTEDPSGVDKDLNGGDGVQSGSTVYFMIKDGDYRFDNDDYWKLKISKGDNGKYVKAVSDITKNFGSNLYNATNGAAVAGTGDARHRYIKVELNEIFTDDEFKITLDMRLTAKDAAVRAFEVDDDTELKISDFSFYMKNMTKNADGDWKVGINGLMLDPLENDWNEVTYYDEDGDLAFMKFFGDSDVGKFYAKLSTKWEHADYASYFNDQDAFIFQFTGSPSLSSTSRADLQIYSPFVDEDGNDTIDPETAVIYQVVDGDLFDVTDSFTYEEGENGDMAYCTRTRFLGTYIICEKPVEEASSDDVVDLVPDDVTPDDNAGAPVDVTPGNTNNGGNGGKAPANTGKF